MKWAKSFQMLYYRGNVWNSADLSSSNNPDMVAQVPWDGAYPWRLQWGWTGSKATMPNGDIFSVLVEPKVGGPNIAGTATHTYDAEALRCFSFHKAK
jgi:hypothetical protein